MADPARPIPAPRMPGAAGPSGQGALAAFWSGFAEPSALAFRVFLGALVLTLGLCLWLFTPATLAGPLGAFLPRSALDAEGFATRAALRAGHAAPDRPRLLLLGTSSMAQSTGTGRLLRDRLEAGTGQPWEVVNLTTPQQAPTDQFVLLETALASQGEGSPMAVVVVGAGIQRLRWTTAQMLEFHEKARVAGSLGWADDEARLLGATVPARTGIFVLDNRNFVLVNGSEMLVRLALLRPARKDHDQYVRGPSRETPRRHALIAAEIRDGVARQDAYLDQIARLAARVAARPNTMMMLVEEPLSPALVEGQGLPDVQTGLSEALRDRAPVDLPPYWPVADEAGLSATDFYDELHVLPGPPQDRFQTVLAERIIAALQARVGSGDGN